MGARRPDGRRSLFPRKVPPLPRLGGPGDGIRRMLAERQAQRHREARAAEKQRFRQIKRAFAEGAGVGAEWLDPAQAWWRSEAQRGLAPARPAARLRHEWKLRAGVFHDAAYADRFWLLERDVRAAFEQGHHAGAYGYDLAEAWLQSPVRASLYPGPPTPLDLTTKLRAGGWPVERARRPGGPSGFAG